MAKTRTIQDVKADFTRKGQSVGGWADAQGLPRAAVYDLLHGRTKGHRGHAHDAAVLLGLKEGELTSQHQGGR